MAPLVAPWLRLRTCADKIEQCVYCNDPVKHEKCFSADE